MRSYRSLWIVLLALLFLPRTSGGQQTIPIGTANWFFSPYNWYMYGTTAAVTNEPGAYFSIQFTNSARAVMNIDTAGIPATNGLTTMVVQWRIDTTDYPQHTLSLSDTQLPLATGLGLGPHTLRFRFVASDYRNDRWTRTVGIAGGFSVPSQSLRIGGLTLDADASVSAPGPLRPLRILFLGDSITEGSIIDPASDAEKTFAPLCARLLNAEYGIVGNAAQGWERREPASGMPFFPASFALFYAETPRFPLPNGVAAPDYVFINMGTNDGLAGIDPALVTADALASLKQIRAYLPASRIFLVAPFGGFEAQALAAAFAQYKIAKPGDRKVSFLNLGPTAQTGLTQKAPGGTPQSTDGLHPNAVTNILLGYQLTAAVQTALGRNDVDGDGKSDLILQHLTSNRIADWFLSNTVVQNGAFVPSVPDGDYQVVGSADFNGDGKPDYVFQNRKTGQIAIWYMDGTNVIGGGLMVNVPDSGYKVVGVGDFNGDGKPDLVFQNQNTNQIAFWFMDGTTLIGGSLLPQAPSANYHVVGVGDFNRDGQNDLLFQDSVAGGLVIWYMNGVQYAGGSLVSGTPAAGYKVEAVADFDGDGRPDLALRDTNGNIALWHLDDARVYLTEMLSLRLDPAFRIAGPR